jgi:pyruvate dehydrogenase E2 component (dihydrolipoamide acetyltransferase)
MPTKNHMTIRRKLTIATWARPREGNIYGKLTVDATNALAWLAYLRETTDERVTITHFVGRVVGEALSQAPGLNGYIRLGRYVPHERTSLAFLVALEEGANLAKAKVDDIDKKSVVDVARELRELAERLRKGKDEEFNKSQGPLHFLPTWLIKPLVFVSGWLTSSLGVGVKALGLTPFPFGSCIVTSVGMFGLDEGYAPPTPFARTPLLVLIGALRDTPVAIDGAVVVRKMITLTATIDHRFMDGYQGGILAKTVREMFESPWKLDGLQAPPPEVAARLAE